jgi:hypothetical protein
LQNKKPPEASGGFLFKFNYWQFVVLEQAFILLQALVPPPFLGVFLGVVVRVAILSHSFAV